MEEECAFLIRYDAQYCLGMAHIDDAVVSGQTRVSSNQGEAYVY